MTDKKRPGSMSDDDRALVHKASSPATPARGVPIHNDPDDDFTPVHSALDRVREVFVPTERERILLQLVWQHTANLELRGRARHDTGDTKALTERIDGCESAIVDIRGESGNNGKIGALGGKLNELSDRMKTAEARRWWAITFLAGLLVTVIVSSIKFGRWMSEIETDVRWLKERRRPSISQPVDAGKETAQ